MAVGDAVPDAVAVLEWDEVCVVVVDDVTVTKSVAEDVLVREEVAVVDSDDVLVAVGVAVRVLVTVLELEDVADIVVEDVMETESDGVAVRVDEEAAVPEQEVESDSECDGLELGKCDDDAVIDVDADVDADSDSADDNDDDADDDDVVLSLTVLLLLMLSL